MDTGIILELTEVMKSGTGHEPDDVSLRAAVLVSTSTVIETPDPTPPYALEARVVVQLKLSELRVESYRSPGRRR